MNSLESMLRAVRSGTCIRRAAKQVYGSYRRYRALTTAAERGAVAAAKLETSDSTRCARYRECYALMCSKVASGACIDQAAASLYGSRASYQKNTTPAERQHIRTLRRLNRSTGSRNLIKPVMINIPVERLQRAKARALGSGQNFSRYVNALIAGDLAA